VFTSDQLTPASQSLLPANGALGQGVFGRFTCRLKKLAGIPPATRDESTSKVKVWVVLCAGDEESVTNTVKVNWPSIVVVPESDPAELTWMPDGKFPDDKLHWYGSVPPIADSALL
jgi:hypothetical protein